MEKYGGNADATFVNMVNYPSSGYTQSRMLSDRYTIDGYSSVGVVGTPYTVHGMSSGTIAGTVSSTSFSFVMNGVNFHDHIRMKLKLAAGDSGGPLVKANQGYSRSVLGICSGGDSTYSNFSKVSNILQSMNGKLY